jgi:PAS domain S-box-containing protein
MQHPDEPLYTQAFHEMANAMPQMVWVGLPDGAVVYINDKINDYLGAFQHEDGTWDWQGVIHPDDLEKTLRLWADARAAGIAFEVEHRLHTKTGEYRWHLNRAKPHLDVSGKPTRWYGSSMDIHLQKEAERALRASEAEFRASFEDASVGMIQIDPETGSFLRINTAFREMMGYSQDVLPGLRFTDILLPEDREQEWAHLQDMVAGRAKGYYSEGRLVRRDGATIWCIRSANLIFDERGKPGRISMVIRDITRKKKAEDALLDSEAKFKAFLHDSPLLAWSKDAEGRYVYLNSSFEKRFNVKLDNWKGKTDMDIHQADYARVFRENDLQVLNTGEPLMGVEQMLESDGSVSEWSSFKFRYTDSEGNAYVGGVGYDITKQRLAEKASAEAREQLELTFRNVPTGILLFNRERKLVFINHKGAQYTGYARSEDVSRDISLEKIRNDNLQRYEMYDEEGRLLSPDNSPVVRSFQTRESNFGVYKMVNRQTGAVEWIYYVCTPVVNARGEVDLVIGTITDITLQKEAENLVLKEQRDSAERLEKLVAQRTKELKDSNEGLQQFAHVASHDLKEPVRKIKIFGGRLRDEYGELLPESAQRYLSKIESAANRMFTMIEGVLLYSSIQAIPENFEKIRVREVIAAIETDLELLIQQRSASIVCGELPEISGVPVMIYQLFYNLINNSIKFARTDMPPEVLITAGEVMVDGTPHHRIVVNDNGIGFEADEVERIFDTFARLHPKDVYDGTGLGLSLCRKIVEKHHGTIEASSEPGQGARFTILLPADPTRLARNEGSP